MDRSPRTTRLLVAVSGLALMLTAGCTSGSSDDAKPAPASAAPESSSSPSSSAPSPGFDAETGQVTRVEPALAVTTDTRRATVCYEADGRDLAYVDYSWRAATDLTVSKVELVDPVGVRLVGRPVTVPPVNYGGRIDYGGILDWKTHEKRLARNRFVTWAGRDRVDLYDFSGGQTGMFVVHLRLAKGTGSSHGLRVTYRTADGSDTYTAEATDDLTWKYVGPRGTCRN